MIRTVLALAIAFSTVAAAPSALAQARSSTQRLADCIERIETDPEGAYEDGLSWMHFGAPPEARHCTALALIGLEEYSEAAARLEELANANDAGGLEPRAIYLTQAGNAWLLASAPEAALVAFNNAVKLAPRDAQIRKAVGRAYLMLAEWTKAGEALDIAVDLSPGDAESHRFRAIALKELGRLEDAWRDVEASISIDPRNVDTLVLRGDIREAMRLKGLDDPVAP